MTRQERRAAFINRWRNTLAGNIALGGEKIRKSLAGQMLTDAIVGEALLGLAPATDSLLGRLFDDLLPAEPEVSHNGRPEEAKRTGK